MWNTGQGTVSARSQGQSGRNAARGGRRADHRGCLVPLLLVLVAPVLGAQSGPAQQGLRGSCSAVHPCRTVLITESTVSRIMGESDGGPALNLGATVGFVSPITPRLGAGVVMMTVLADRPFLAVAPRLRIHTSPNTAVDLSPGLIVAGDREGTGRLSLDASWMYRDRIGWSVQIDRVVESITTMYPAPPQVVGRSVVRTGLRLGSGPGRTGMIVQAAVVVVALAAFSVGCSSGCGGW